MLDSRDSQDIARVVRKIGRRARKDTELAARRKRPGSVRRLNPVAKDPRKALHSLVWIAIVCVIVVVLVYAGHFDWLIR